MYITGHNRYSFRMDSAKIPDINKTTLLRRGESKRKTHARVFKQMNEKCFASFLQSKDSRTLPTKPSISVLATGVGDHVKRNVAHLPTSCQRNRATRGKAGDARSYHARKGELAQEQIRALLIPPDFTKGDGARSVPPLFCRRVTTWRGISTCAKIAKSKTTTIPCRPRVNAPVPRPSSQSLRRKERHIRCLDGPARGAPLSSSPSSSSSSPPPPCCLSEGSRPPVDLRAVCVCATLTRFGRGGVES